MTVDERQWRELYERLERSLGADGADTLMSLLPPVGWADVATKRDLDLLGERINSSAQQVVNTMTWRVLGMLFATVGLVAGLVLPLAH